MRILRIFVKRTPRPYIVGATPLPRPLMKKKFVCCMAFCLAASLASPGQTSQAAAYRAQRLQRVEATTIEVGGRPGEAPVRLSLAELMKTYAVPGLSLVVIESYKIVDTKAYGVIEPGPRSR